LLSSARARLGALGLRPRKRLSQSFLEDASVAADVVRAASLTPSTDVLEIGPGLGVMTQRLATRARRVVAVEIDPELAEVVRTDVSDQNVTVVTGDILRFEPNEYFDEAFVVVANLPYHITSPALRHVLISGPPFAKRLVVMVQEEVAERIAARPGQMSALAVVLQVQADVTLVRRVPAAAFYPRPKVNSAVLLLEPLPASQRAIQREELEAFTTLVQAGFKQPRKTLANSLADGLSTSRKETSDRLGRANIDPGVRPQTLGVADWVRLFRTP
jgi:16S rRNA (adenine1518-N6/adenine1519-N6)-dimethyltransferase